MDLVYARLEEASSRPGRWLPRAPISTSPIRGSFVREEDGTGLTSGTCSRTRPRGWPCSTPSTKAGVRSTGPDRRRDPVRGRIGVRDADYEPLVIDWRAPAAEPFYRATPVNPMQVVRRRAPACSGDRVIGIEDDLSTTGPDADIVVVGEGALMAALVGLAARRCATSSPPSRPSRTKAIRRAVAGLHHDLRRPGHRQDRRRPAPGSLPALHPLPTVRERRRPGGRPEPGVHELHRTGAGRPRRGRGDPPVDRHRGQRRRGHCGERTDDAGVATIKGSLRMATVLKRLVNEPWQDVPLELFVTLAGARAPGWAPRSSTRIRSTCWRTPS